MEDSNCGRCTILHSHKMEWSMRQECGTDQFSSYTLQTVLSCWRHIDCKFGFQDADFAGHLTNSKSTSGGVLCIFGSHTCVPFSWVCSNLSSASHSTDGEVISLHAGLRTEGIPALSSRSTVIEVLHPRAEGDPMQTENQNANNLMYTIRALAGNIDHVPPNA